MFKVNNRNTRKRYEICLKLTIKTKKPLHSIPHENIRKPLVQVITTSTSTRKTTFMIFWKTSTSKSNSLEMFLNTRFLKINRSILI